MGALDDLDTRLEHWSDLVRILPIPGALLDGDGRVLARSRWLDAVPGELLVSPPAHGLGPGTATDADGSPWRIRELGPSAFLATAEREDAGIHILEQFFASGIDLYVVYDQRGRVLHANRAWEHHFGVASKRIEGMNAWELLTPDKGLDRGAIERKLVQTGRAIAEFWHTNEQGEERLFHFTLQFLPTIGRCFGIARDITEQFRLEEELQRRAYTDELTGLPNRAHLLEHLGRLLADGARPAILFFDLDRFKVINDSLGHHAGDRLLAALAHRLDALADEPDSMVARLGGDEFVAVIGNADEDRARAAAEETQAAMAEPFELDGRLVHLGLSIGITVAGGGRTPEQLLGEADTAAYAAKSTRRSSYTVFDDELRKAVDRRFEVEWGLRRALRNDGIEAVFQPIVSLPDGSVTGMEALVRWRLDDGTIVGPGEFLDVAEEAGLMPEVGKAVRRQAFSAAATLAKHHRGLLLTVNVSAGELVTGCFVHDVLADVADAGLDPSSLLLEITESTVLTTQTTLPMLEQLRAHGIRIGLDDFGTGFSSLTHLRELPIDVVKIDRSFAAGIESDPVTRALCGSLVGLSDALELDLIVEGIETSEQAKAFAALGARSAQGFLFHRPMPFDDLAAVVDGSAER